MITNLLIVVFVILAALWFSNQGLFSSLLHLIVTLCAGALAFAFWEPLTINYLIDRMPEYAWAVGLLVPFILALLLIRVVLDKLVPGNVKFHNLVDMFGGGAVGAIAGILAAGVLVIGLQFISGFGLGGYKPFAIGVNGQIDRAAKLWIPVDDIAGSTFTTLSGGTFLPWSGKSLGVYQPNIVERAGTYSLNSRDGARNAIRPANVEVTGYVTLPAADLPEAVSRGDGNQAAVVSTDIQLVAGEETAGAADVDGSFTATRAQVGLIAVSKTKRPKAKLVYADGYVVGKDFGTLTDPQEFARSRPAVDNQSFDWIFHLPDDYEPRFIVIKQLRLPITEDMIKPNGDAEQWLTATRWIPEPEDGDGPSNGNDTSMGNQTGPPVGAEGLRIEVNDALPRSLSRNWINTSSPNASFDDENDALIRANGVIRLSGQIGRGLAIDRVSHSPNTAIVRVQFSPKKAQSLYGKAMQFAAQVAAPVLVSDDGAKYSAIGWARANSAEVEVQIDTARTIRSMAEVKVNDLRDNEELYLYFRTGKGVRITSFQIGQTKQEVDLTVPKE